MSRPSLIDKADAFGGVLVCEDGKILLREPKSHYGGYVWTFPKGGAEAGESATEAALREVQEETKQVFRGESNTTWRERRTVCSSQPRRVGRLRMPTLEKGNHATRQTDHC